MMDETEATREAAASTDAPVESTTDQSAELRQARRVLEGLLFVSDQPVTLKRLRSVLQGLEPNLVKQLIDELNREYAEQEHAFRIQEIAGGYQLVTDPQLAARLKRALELRQHDRLSKAALETLAIVAYRQPLSKADIELIRGVDGGAGIETLLERQMIQVVGRKETPGRPLLYGTTTEFLRHFGLKDVGELPPMPTSGVLPSLGDDAADATAVHGDQAAASEPAEALVGAASESEQTADSSSSAAIGADQPDDGATT